MGSSAASIPRRRPDGQGARPTAAAVPKKLGIEAGSTLALLGAPPGFEPNLGRLPDGVRVVREAGGARVGSCSSRNRAPTSSAGFPVAARALADGGGIWIAWPKQASGMATDLTQAGVREFGLGAGFVDYKICAIDSTWSGLLFACRSAARAARRG